MSERLQFSGDYNHYCIPEDEQRDVRRFFMYLYAVALLLSIPASVIIAIVTKNPFPGLIPAPLLLSMRPMIKWAFSHSPDAK